MTTYEKEQIVLRLVIAQKLLIKMIIYLLCWECTEWMGTCFPSPGLTFILAVSVIRHTVVQPIQWPVQNTCQELPRHLSIMEFCLWSYIKWPRNSLFCWVYPPTWCDPSKCYVYRFSTVHMMTSSNGNIFRVTGHLCGEFTGPRWIHRTKASDAELWCFVWSGPE